MRSTSSTRSNVRASDSVRRLTTARKPVVSFVRSSWRSAHFICSSLSGHRSHGCARTASHAFDDPGTPAEATAAKVDHQTGMERGNLLASARVAFVPRRTLRVPRLLHQRPVLGEVAAIALQMLPVAVQESFVPFDLTLLPGHAP